MKWYKNRQSGLLRGNGSNTDARINVGVELLQERGRAAQVKLLSNLLSSEVHSFLADCFDKIMDQQVYYAFIQ